MANSNFISLSKVDLLTGTNYHIWELKVSAILRSRKLYKAVIEGPEPEYRGDDASEKARLEWEEKNDEAFGIIIVTLSEEQAGLFIGQKSTKYVWDELRRIHSGNVEDRRIDTALELKNIRMGGNETIDNYITRARTIATRSAALGQIIPAREVVYHVVRGLHPKMENVAAVLRPQRSATLEDVQQSLREEEIRINSKGESHHFNNNSKSEGAFKAKIFRGGNHNRNTDRKCFVCSKPGHVAKDCWHRQTGKESENRGKFETYRGRGNQNFRGRGGGRGKEHANIAEYKYENAFNASLQSSAANHDDTSELEFWILDSGCTSHMTPRKDWMKEIKSVRSEVTLAEEGRKIEAEAKGKVKLTTKTNDGEEHLISVNDVLYVPKLRSNLLSVRSLISNGNEIIFNQDGAKIFNQRNELIGEAYERDRMFVIETKPRETEIIGDCFSANQELVHKKTMSNLKTSSSENSEKIRWHKRLGHLNEEDMEKLKRNEMVKGLLFESKKLGICEPCILGKMVQNPFKTIDQKSARKPLELIHMDLCGPLPRKSLGGALYIYVLVDSYSRRIFVYFLKSKDETYEYFVEFKNQRENELNCKIKNVRSDNGTEFTNKKFEELFKKEGIRHQRTVPYTPQSNGVAERANITLLDKARTILIDAELPYEFWAEAVATAAYLKNCTPSKNCELKTPMELWSGNIPKVSHLKVFGSVVYYHVPKIHRNKLQPKAKKGIFVGYSRKRRAYRVFIPERGQVIEIRTAKFDENSKGAELLNRKKFEEGEIENLKYGEDISNTDEEDIIQEMVQPRPIENQDRNLRNDEQDDREQQREPRRRGRKQGETNEMIRIRHEDQLIEREQRLVAEGVRRSERKILENQAIISMETEENQPKSYKEAMTSIYSDSWKSAMDEEMKSLQIHKVWKLTNKTENMKVLKSKWVFNTKENPDGTVDKRKARLVAVGYNQRPGVDYEDSFAPVMKMESLRILIALASQLKLKIRQYDVKTAYLYGELKETTYMEQPEGYVKIGDEGKVCELQKSLYGLPQSGRCWNDKLHSVLTNIGLRRLDSDPCVYTLKTGKELFMMGIYVDDILVIGTSNEIIEDIMEKVRKHFTITEVSKPVFFLGIEIQESEKGFELSQRKYVKKILERFGLTDCNPVKNPGDAHQDLDQSEESPPVDQKEYLEMIGSLMYLSVGTRPDITYHVSRLSQYSQNPKQIHLTAVKRVYRYLKGTQDYKLLHDREQGQVVTSTDASWCSTKDAKSYSGYSVKLGNSLISWKSKKQNLVALSTCEAELIAICEGVKEIKWTINFLSELEMKEYIKLPIELNTDSKSAIDWIKSTGQHSRTKHINRKYYFVRDEVQKGNVKIKFVRSEEMEADILTKTITGEAAKKCIKKFGLII